MNLIEQATKRLEELERAGVEVPWAAARLGPNHLRPVSAEPQGLEPLRRESPPAAAIEPSGRPPLKATVSFDLERLRSAGYLVPDQVRSELAEQMRAVKRPLLKTARASGPGERGALVMVTSGLPGEGKTFCSVNLAMSMAMEIDTAVILVDADVVRPSVFDRLGITDMPLGMLDYLAGDTDQLQDVLVETNVPKLLLMSAGRSNARSTELLASNAMDRLIEQLASDYADHIVIFDAPPVLLTTESTVLASKVGQVLVVVQNGKTTKEVVQQTFAAIRNCPVVVSVLNQCEEDSDVRRYGHYYR